jgi:hypothetical protein
MKELKEVKEMLKNVLETQNNKIIQQTTIENQTNIGNINIQNNVTLINFGEENFDGSLIKKMRNDIYDILENHTSRCVIKLAETIHSGEKYPEYANLYIKENKPLICCYYKNDKFNEGDVGNILKHCIDDKIDILDIYVSSELENDDIKKEYKLTRNKIKDDKKTYTKTRKEIVNILRNVGKKY